MRIITEENYENLIGMINEWESMYKAAQARITELETALSKIVANDDKWKGWSDEQKSKVQWWHQGSIARAALGIKETR